MDTSRRRQTLGRYPTAALPQLWKALARRGWSHATFAREAGMTSASASHLLYGDYAPDGGGDFVSWCQRVLGVPKAFWKKPCPPNWRPHDYPDQRQKARTASGSGADLSDLTGTDD